MDFYQEQLPDGGKLKVFANQWEIEYYFSGPDLRYNGTFIRFADRDVPKLVDAYRSAYERYSQLKQSSITGGELKVDASMGLTIRVGGPFDGVCMASYRNPVNNDSKLQHKLASYEKKRCCGHQGFSKPLRTCEVYGEPTSTPLCCKIH